ncbi:MAG TPA: glycosyltransferase [Puia sp.]|jgi:glycosyltransferase involved in cell wall biosynthesis|nr:glycosyltransferase [Puia sp.]
MRILLDCRRLRPAGPAADKTRLLFSAAAMLSAEDGIEWLILMDHRYRPGLFPELPGQVITRRSLPGRLGWRWWHDRVIRRLARQQHIDMVWLTGGVAARGMRVPFCVWMPVGGGDARLKPGLERAAAVICYSERERDRLEGMMPAAEGKIHVLTPVADESIGVIPEIEKEKIKAEKAKGREYFLADLTGCGEGEVMNILKAFSLFKKRQQSQMRLVFTGTIRAAKRMEERLKTYKYRQDVDWPGDAPDSEKLALAGAAYAVVLPVEGNGLGVKLLDRWKAGVPVIAAGGGRLEEMAQGAALGMAPGDPASLAAQLMRIYKEEDLRQELTRKGFERLKVYSRENFLGVLRVITEIAAC